jgi:oxaloacetate decarboxylase alpha subunit
MTYELVKRFKEVLSIPVQLHSHYTSGMAGAAYFKAVEAGVDIVDTALSPLAMGTSQPATETFVAELEGTPYDTGLDLAKMFPIAEHFKKARKNYHIDADVVLGVDANVLTYQIPGGMLSNFASQLAGQLDKLPAVLEEMPRVRKDLGYPPLVTPSSQMVGSQAVLNVLAGERYKMVSSEVKAYVGGYYGRSPAPIDPEFKKKIIGDKPVITQRPADLLEPGLPQAKKEVAQYMETDEDVLSYVAFPQVAMKFLQERQAKKYRVDFNLVEEAEKAGDKGKYPVQ